MGEVCIEAAGMALAVHGVRRRRRRARRARKVWGGGVVELGILVEALEMVRVLETVKDLLPKLLSAGRAGNAASISDVGGAGREAHAPAGTGCCWYY